MRAYSKNWSTRKDKLRMPAIEFSKEEKEQLVQRFQAYFRDELDHELGQFDALFLLDFIAENIGAYFYNRGLYDSHTILEQRLESLGDAIYELEKPTGFSKA